MGTSTVGFCCPFCGEFVHTSNRLPTYTEGLARNNLQSCEEEARNLSGPGSYGMSADYRLSTSPGNIFLSVLF